MHFIFQIAAGILLSCILIGILPLVVVVAFALFRGLAIAAAAILGFLSAYAGAVFLAGAVPKAWLAPDSAATALFCALAIVGSAAFAYGARQCVIDYRASVAGRGA